MSVRRISCLAAAMMATLLGAFSAAQTGTAQTETTEIRVESKPIPFKVTYEFSRSVGRGRLVTARKGVPGEVIKTYSVVYRDGKPVSKTLVSTEKKPPVDELVHMGTHGYTPSRHKFTRRKVMTMTATAYDPSPQTIPGTTGRTATGMYATYGIIAVDPRVIKLGTLCYVEGYGFAIAADTGGAIKGNKIDLCFDHRSTALRFGRKKVRVHVLG